MHVMWKYVMVAYGLFWIMVLAIGGTASMVLEVSPLTMRWIANLCAWSPTFALLLMFPRLRPGMTITEFYRKAFGPKLRFDWLFFSTIAVMGGVLLPVWILAVAEGQALTSFFRPSAYALPLTFVLSLLSGPTGEESGWRGYLRVELNKHYGFVKGSLLLGVVWAFWHAVLWFIDSDFQGLALITYIVANVIVMTGLTLIMNVVLERSDNLFNAIWLHLCFNFLYGFLAVGIDFYVVLSIVYAVIGGGFLAYHLRSESRVMGAAEA